MNPQKPDDAIGKTGRAIAKNHESPKHLPDFMIPGLSPHGEFAPLSVESNGVKCGATGDNYNRRKKAFSCEKQAEAEVGFEPTNNGFAIRPLSPLGYSATGKRDYPPQAFYSRKAVTTGGFIEQAYRADRMPGNSAMFESRDMVPWPAAQRSRRCLPLLVFGPSA